MAKDFLRVNVVADKIGVSILHVYRLIRSGHLAAIDISDAGKIGAGTIRVSRASVDKFISARAIDPSRYHE